MSTLDEAEALLLEMAERTTTQSVSRKLTRAARSFYWPESPGSEAKDDSP